MITPNRGGRTPYRLRENSARDGLFFHIIRALACWKVGAFRLYVSHVIAGSRDCYTALLPERRGPLRAGRSNGNGVIPRCYRGRDTGYPVPHNNRPFGAPYLAHLCLLFVLHGLPRDLPRKTRGRVVRYSFLVRIFHPLLPAGLSRRTTPCLFINIARERF